jgi:hypothetical protein
MRAVSLSQEPAYTALKQYFVCGTHDITGEPYAGVSNLHDNFGNAVPTTNGAGPHNVQLFMLSPDGTVLNVLPGYWSPRDLVYEMQFAAQLNDVWTNAKLSKGQKDATFVRMHLEHAREHPPEMSQRSHLQGFDAMYEAETRPETSDFIKDHKLAESYEKAGDKHLPPNIYRTTDQVMHERMAKQRGFVAYQHFDVASFVEYGKQKYDKNEDYMMANGQVDHEKAMQAQQIGMTKEMHGRNRNNAPQYNANEWGNSSRPWGVQPGQ